MTQRINDKLKKCCELCQSNLDKPCAWLSLGNEYCDTIMEVQSDIEIKDKVINYIAKHTYIRTGENGVLGTITEEVIEHLYKKVEEEKC